MVSGMGFGVGVRLASAVTVSVELPEPLTEVGLKVAVNPAGGKPETVSYTHLTLPTIYSV